MQEDTEGAARPKHVMSNSQPPPRPPDDDALGFTRKPMVGWLSAGFLIGAAREVGESGRFARFTDKREVEAGLPSALYELPNLETCESELASYDDPSHRDENGDLWIDFVSDVGEGFAPTYTVAWLAARPRLTLRDEHERHETKRGRILALGGDQVYPSASWTAYRDRFVGPYKAALPWVDEDGGELAPHLFAIPGNHDWYDGLTSFLRVLCAGSWVGGWRTRQRRSYFAIQLSERWWLWGTDTQFDTYLDTAQLDYFRAAARALNPDDRVILVTAKPSWLRHGQPRREMMADGPWETLSYIEEHLVADRGAKVALTLTGDKHHYSRYAAEGEFPEQRITAGGGGAHTSATHGLPADVRLPVHGSERTTTYVRQDILSPTVEESKRMRWHILYRVFAAVTTGLVTAVIYGLVAGLFEVTWIAGAGMSLLVAALLTAFAKLKQPAGPVKATALGTLHAGAHVGAVLGLAEAGLAWPVIALIGFPLGLAIFGLYLLGANLTDANQHATEIYGGLASTKYKNFLRLRLASDGSLTIYPVGIKNPPDWRLHSEGTEKSPWFAADGYDEDDAQATLLEPPITVAKPPPPAGKEGASAGD